MSIGLIGRKVGMTQVFQDDGTMVAVSVLAVEPNTVTRLRTTARDGYTAVQLGTDVAAKLTKPEAGQLKGLPKVASIREFRVDDVDAYEVGQTLSVDDVFAAGDLVDVTGISKGKGFAGAHQAPQLPARSQDPRFGPPSRPGLDRAGHDARSGLQGHEDGRSHGRRAGHRQEGPGRPDRPRAQPPPRERHAAGLARLTHPREEGLTMPQTTLYDRTGASIGSVELSDELFDAPINAAVLHQVVTAQLAGRHLGHPRHEDPRRGPRRRPQAVPPEGHRPRPPGPSDRAPLPWRRRRLRAAPALVRPAPAAQDEAARPARRPDRQVRRRRDQGDRRLRARGDQDPRPRRRAGRGRAPPAGCSLVAPARDERLHLSSRNLPTVEVILADSLNVVDLLNADMVLIEQPALARMEEVYA